MHNSKKSKLLLINPWQTYDKHLKTEYQSYIPYGLACIASIGIQDGFNTKILDCLEDETITEFDDKIRFGKTKEDVELFIRNFKPEIVGISSSFSMFESDATEIAKLVKKIDSTTIIILGGVTATIEEIYTPLLKLGIYNIMIKGEGELTFRELLKNYDIKTKRINNISSIKGIAYMDCDSIITTKDRPYIENLSDLPFPALNLLNIDKAIQNKYYCRWRNNPTNKKTFPIFTSRGCPYKCIFCSVHSQVGYKYRVYNPNYVIELMKKCINDFSINHFHFEDDNLTLNKDRAKSLFKEIAKLNITWDTPNGIRADTIDEEMIQLMKMSGITSLSIAAESGNENVRINIIKKQLSTNSILKAVQLCDKYDIPCIIFFVLGFPGERLKDIKESISFAKKLAVQYGTINIIFIANPLPGTELSSIARNKGYIQKNLTNADYFEAVRANQNSIIETDEFNKKAIYKLLTDELNSEKFTVSNPAIPMFWANTSTAWSRAKRAFPRGPNKKIKWIWKG